MSKVQSKGKWLPGTRDAARTWFYCESCERGFSKSASYDRHLSTELHFKRAATGTHSGSLKREGCGSYVEDPDFFEEVHIQSPRTRRVNKTSRSHFTRNCTITCPTCLANVEKHQMGKHLISHFHCQRTTTKGRLSNPEKALILEHMQDIVVQSPFQCSNCKFYFTQRNQLLNHVSNYHAQLEIRTRTPSKDSLGWSCSACIGICAMNVESLVKHLNSDSHMKMEVAIAKSIPIIVRQIALQSCIICDKKFKLHRPLLSHYKQQHQLVVHQDQEDREGSPDVRNTFKQTNTGHKTNQISHEAEFEEKTNTENIIRAGESQHPTAILDPPGNVSQVCSLCWTAFGSESSLNRHISHAHPNINGYKCDQCNYCNKKRSHYSHLKTHDPNRLKLYKCDKCEASFHEKYALTFHNKIHDGKPCNCDYPGCDFVGRSKADIKVHSVKHQHASSNPCEQCEYSTKSLKHLNRHVKLRHAETADVKPFSCRYCHFKAKLKDGIKRHEKKHLKCHAYVCPYCAYKTHDLEFLRSHILKRNHHPGEFMYNCGICMKTGSNTYKSNLFQDYRNHIIREHPDIVYSKSDVLIISGLQREFNKADNLPEVPLEEASKLENTHLHEDQNLVPKLITEITTKKDLEYSAKDVSIHIHTNHIQSLQQEAITGIEVEGQLLRSQISDFTDCTAASDAVTNESYEHGLTLVSSFATSEINLDIGSSIFDEQSLPCVKETYFDLSNVLVSSVEDLGAGAFQSQ